MRPSARIYLRLLVRYLRPQLGQTLLLLFVLCANILLQLINPLIMRRLLDSALAGGAVELLTRLALSFIAIARIYGARNGWTGQGNIQFGDVTAGGQICETGFGA